jgi:hypothetical protein
MAVLNTAENYSQLVQDADYLAGDLAVTSESELLNYLYNHFMKVSFAQKVSAASNFRPEVINSRLFAELMRRVMDTHSIDDIFTEPGWKEIIESWVKRNNNLIPTELTELALSGSAMKNLPAPIQDWIRITMDTQCEKQIPASMTAGFFGRSLEPAAKDTVSQEGNVEDVSTNGSHAPPSSRRRHTAHAILILIFYPVLFGL